MQLASFLLLWYCFDMNYKFVANPPKKEVREFISTRHYTGTCGNGIIHSFALMEHDKMIGACVFSNPSRQGITIPCVYLILELSRLFIVDETVKNTESWFIAQCLNWLKKNTDYEAVVSFSDPTEGHQGGIYKACNFKLMGVTSKNYGYIQPNGEPMHKRQVWNRAQQNGVSEKEQADNEGLTLKRQLPKNKFYIYLKKPKHPYLVYALIDPITEEVRYVGKSEQGPARWREHLRKSSLAKGTHKDHWIESLLAQNLLPQMKVLEELKDPKDLFQAEEIWEQYYLHEGAYLTNEVPCGGGTRGYKHKASTIEKLREGALKRDKTNYQNPHNKKHHLIKDGVEYRECAKCVQLLPLDQFSKAKRVQTYCKACRREYQKVWKAAHPSPKLSKEEYAYAHRHVSLAGGLATAASPEARRKIGEKNSKRIKAVHCDTGEVLIFDSALKAKAWGFQNTNIGQAIKYNKPYRNYMWTFEEK